MANPNAGIETNKIGVMTVNIDDTSVRVVKIDDALESMNGLLLVLTLWITSSSVNKHSTNHAVWKYACWGQRVIVRLNCNLSYLIFCQKQIFYSNC